MRNNVLDAYRELIDELLGTPSAIRRHAAGRTLPAPVARLVAESRDRDRAVMRRVQAIIQERNAQLRAWRAAEVEIPDDATLLDEFEHARGDLVSLLMNLTLKEWEKSATHEVDGEISLAEEVERHVDFDEQQRAVIDQALG